MIRVVSGQWSLFTLLLALYFISPFTNICNIIICMYTINIDYSTCVPALPRPTLLMDLWGLVLAGRSFEADHVIGFRAGRAGTSAPLLETPSSVSRDVPSSSIPEAEGSLGSGSTMGEVSSMSSAMAAARSDGNNKILWCFVRRNGYIEIRKLFPES